ncbi:MAG: acetolactate synthase [Piscirickettsiaceae bacterium]|nr:MAG: acetolactate synthase [Piscirickettsiaceae bacterium]
MSTVVSEIIKTKQTDTCDLLIKYLEQLGVEYIFGVPGGPIEPLYNALSRSEQRGGIRAITARHETGAAFMADAYARNTGKLGVCCSTTAPGATNLITGVSSSYANNTPLLVITAQNAQNKHGKKAIQESGDTGINILGMMQFCTRFNSLVYHTEQFEQKFISAIMAAFGSPHGPAHLSIPTDILRANIKQAKLIDFRKITTRPALQDTESINRLIKEVSNSKKMVIVIGHGAKKAIGSIYQLINNYDALVVDTPDSKSFINPYHPLYRGVIGFAGHQSATEALKDDNVDTILAIGTSFSEFTSDANLFSNKLIHIDDTDDNFTRSTMAKLQVRGDIEATINALLKSHNKSAKNRADADYKHYKSVIDKTSLFANKQIEQKKIPHFAFDEPDKLTNESVPIKPQWLMGELTKLFPPNTRYIIDIGNSFAWATHYLHPTDRRTEQRRKDSRDIAERRKHTDGLVQICSEFSSMGWSIGSAIGLALATPGEPVVCIVGDGSYLMSGQEITVAIEEKLPIIFLIMNDQQLGMVKHGQQLNNSADIANVLPNISFSLMAASMGAMGYPIETPDDLRNLNINAICNRKGPSLLDIRIDPNEIPPIAARIKTLQYD